MNNVMIFLKDLEKQEQTSLQKKKRQGEIIKIRAEINNKQSKK